MNILDKTIICPGCGWTGFEKDLESVGDLSLVCPSCGYENNAWGSNYKLYTLTEMMEHDCEYNDVRMDLFLASLIKVYREHGFLKE